RTYAVYRYSHHLEGKYVLRGTIDIDPKPSGRIATFEKYSVQTMAKEGVSQVSFDRDGHLIFRDNAPLIVSCKVNSRDIQTINIQHKLPSGPGSIDAKVTWMHGVVTDWEDNQFYTTRIVILEQGSRVKARNFVRAVKPAEVPERVRHLLDEPINQNYP